MSNVKDYIEGDMDLFDGYDALPDDIQAKVKRALDQGHVDDEDWKGVCPILSSPYVLCVSLEALNNHHFIWFPGSR